MSPHRYEAFEVEWFWWALRNFLYMACHCMNQVLVPNMLPQAAIVMSLILVDMLALFYARPWMADWQVYTIIDLCRSY